MVGHTAVSAARNQGEMIAGAGLSGDTLLDTPRGCFPGDSKPHQVENGG